ncbi:P-loop containing nucleoside triphosphate hydrolase protein [Mycena albidolilacea]|uniref:P-loop containing nucleoside triphosphate hydrolase protein n=1 Tax=Mycena albidolilacea TaxID=1033008 RepID=A0AAD7EC42_9AGAR|nr:P-loop containing nucleoside triphosphate hydrolase protein [Mycena albidolilacea]
MSLLNWRWRLQLGVEFGSKLITLPSLEAIVVKLQCWDTSFRSITRSYYCGAAGCLLVYDVTSRRSFDSVRTWLADVRAHADAHVSCILVGNKVDLVGRGTEGSGEGPVRERGEVARISGERKSEAGSGGRGEVSKICIPEHRPQLLAAGQAEPERPEAVRVGVGVGRSRACRARCVTDRSALVPMQIGAHARRQGTCAQSGPAHGRFTPRFGKRDLEHLEDAKASSDSNLSD